jgi:hypothetical protein
VKNLTLIGLGAYCAIGTVISFVGGFVLMGTSGVQVLIPETGGHKTIDWMSDVDGASGAFFAGAWLIILGGFFALVAFVGFYFALRDAAPLMILVPILTAVGFTLVTVSHLIPISMAYGLVPDYFDATGATQSSLGTTADTFASLAHVTNYAGDALLWGVVTPLCAWAVLATGIVHRWIGWLGLVAAFFAGWLGLAAPASSLIDGLTSIGFLAFFLFVAALGIALLRRKEI